MNTKIITPLMLVLAASFSHAQTITYTDAVSGASGNTFATGGSLSNTSWLGAPNTSAQSNTLWAERTPFANNGNVFQANPSVTGSIPELTTEVTGLLDGTYDVWVFFWTNNEPWNISAGLTSGSLMTYSPPGGGGLGNTTDAVLASTLSYDVTPLLTEAPDRLMYGVNIGQATVTGGSAINVFIGHNLGSNTANRTWYDGVGVAATIPEPSSFALIVSSIALGILIIRRQRNG
ncbi:hypothetical protein [Rubellicoccus peritrichatus]|uniref:PEP-CTERM protein-sorting domain-containing protein n=1 Tax=Rubellicoccus peritrichatus TaxID=3080537 RepID=A0AAQ3LC72_9BACT|nr:hypothetical protein [Puniceicoccus sp. CR14]WOO40843.1 hypothetical protein RZN69_19645 [Puniceicoccus sp. CR14]